MPSKRRVNRETQCSNLFNDRSPLLHTQMADRAWPHDRAVKGETIIRPENSLLPTQGVFRITSQVRDDSSLLKHLIPKAHGHNNRPSSVVIPSSLIYLSHTTPTSSMFDIMPYSIAAGSQRDQSAAEKELPKHTDIHDRRGTRYRAKGVSPIIRVDASQRQKAFPGFFQKSLVSSLCTHLI